MTSKTPESVQETVQDEQQAAPHKRPEWLVALIVGLGASLIGGLFVSAFLWPLTTAEPKDIEYGMAGPTQQTKLIEMQIYEQHPGLLKSRTYENREEVVRAIERQEISGGVVAEGPEIEFLTASAGSPAISQALTNLGNGIKEQMAQQAAKAPASAPRQTVTMTDVVPGKTGSNAAILLVFPALITSIAASVIGLFTVRRPGRRSYVLLAATLGAGLIGALALGPWFGAMQGSFWLSAAALAMGVLAIAGFVSGLAAVFGKAGLGLGIVTIVLFGNPWSGSMVPREFLAQPWGSIGAAMPNANLVSLLRSISYFPDAPTSANWWTLAIWALCGFALLGIGALRARSKA